jgi:hypothetical protein
MVLLLNHFLTVILFCLHLNVHGDLKGGWENKYYPFRRRPIDYFDKRYDQAKLTLKKLQARHRAPISVFSKNYKKWLDRKNAFEMEFKLKQEGKTLDTSSKEYKILLKYSKDKEQQAKSQEFIDKIKIYRENRAKNKRWLRARLDMGLGEIMRPELMNGPFDNFWFEKQLLNYYKFSWKNLQFGLTITEIEKVLVIISFIRFCFYTIRYDAKSALIISLTAFISAILYEKILVDVIKICYFRFYLNPSLFRTGFEQYLQMVHNEKKFTRYSLESFKWLDIYPGWLINVILKSPILSDIQSYVDDTLMPVIFKFIRLYRKPMQSLLFYTLILRLGKKYVPYPLQWHGMVYTMYTQGLAALIFNRYVNSMKFLRDILIPQARIGEIEMLEMIQATFLITFIYGIILAMLHAVFSQYYYFPFLAQNIDAHIGKRPKDSILSGGYASWQDEQKLFIPSKADYKIWFGFLGKQTNDSKLNIKRRPKITLAANLGFLILGLIIFNFLWILQPNNLDSVRYQSDSFKMPLELINEVGVELPNDADYDTQ